jgi:two-component system cell cycle sensor histidine kinase/response regulator CckA
LSAVLGLAKSFGGFVEVDSAVGRGSEFRVYLPAAKETVPEQPAAPALPRGRGEVILVIDDEEQIRSLARATLEAFGYRVLTAADGAEGVALFTRHRGEVKAVITDMMMPVMDGPATIRALHGLEPTLPIIASSGLSSPQTADVSGVRVHAFLQKPYSAGQLLQTLRKLLGG